MKRPINYTRGVEENPIAERMRMADRINRLIGHVPTAPKAYNRVEHIESRAAQRRLRQIRKGQLTPSKR